MIRLNNFRKKKRKKKKSGKKIAARSSEDNLEELDEVEASLRSGLYFVPEIWTGLESTVLKKIIDWRKRALLRSILIS